MNEGRAGPEDGVLINRTLTSLLLSAVTLLTVVTFLTAMTKYLAKEKKFWITVWRGAAIPNGDVT